MPMIERIDVLLKDWAEHRHRYEHGGLGYPSQSPEGRMRQSAGVPTGVPGPTLPAVIPNRVHRVETAVRRMPPPWRDTVEIGYLERGDREVQAQLLGRRLRRRVSRHGFARLMNESHIWLAGHLAR